jgi:opacity protein-like surface antigen
MKKNVVGLIALALFATLAQAEDYASPTEDRVRLSLGVARYSNKTDIQINSSTGVAGTPINAEDQFGLDKTDYEAKIQAMVRVGERHRLRFDYFSLDRTGQTTVGQQPIVFRDVVLQPGDPLNSDLSIRTFGITYGYSFLHSDKYEVAATIGINDTDISARARVQTQARHVDQTEDQAGPFPTLGLDGTYVVSKRFYLDGRAQYFKVHIDNIDGSIGIYELDGLYRLRENISFAVGYTYLRAHLASTQTRQSGLFNFNSSGPEIFLRVAF